MNHNLFSLLLLLLLMNSATVLAQNARDTIQVKKNFGTSYHQGGVRLRMNDLIKIAESNPEALEAMKKAKTNYNAASVFGMAGGFLIGWPLGTAIGGGDPNWTLAAIGAGLIVISIPITSAYNKHALNGVRIHNSDVRRVSARRGVAFNMQFTGNGARLKLTF